MTAFRAVIAAAALVVAISAPAFGLEANGMIVNVDVTAGTITLGNGQTFKIAEAEFFKTIKLGDMVSIEYTSDANGLLVATAIKTAI